MPTPRAPVLLALAVTAPLLAGCLSLDDPLGRDPTHAWENRADLATEFDVAGSLLGGNLEQVDGANFSLPEGTTTLRLEASVTLSSPGNVTVTLEGPDGVVYEESFEASDEADFQRFDPAPGDWRLTVRAMGDGEATVRVDARVPTAS